MKSPHFLILSLMTTAAQAQMINTYGHWPAGKVRNSTATGVFKIHDFEFAVSDQKIGRFLECARKKYPRTELFIEGVSDPATGKVVATTAFLCRGEIGLGTCQTGVQWFCR